MLLLLAVLIISFEAIGEGLLKRFSLAEFIFKLWVQWVIALLLFVAWFLFAYHFDGFYIPIWKMITGFVFIRFAIFDPIFNLSLGVKITYIGTTKLYDRILQKIVHMGGMGTLIFIRVILLLIALAWFLNIGQ